MKIDVHAAPGRHATGHLPQKKERSPENGGPDRKDISAMPGIRNVVEARPVQDTQLAVVVLETEIEVLPERLHVGVVVEPVGDHAPLETAELVDRRDQQKEQHDRVCVMDPAPSIEHQSRHGDEKQADYDAFVPEKGTQQRLFVVDEDREQVQREHDESEDNERSPTAPPRAPTVE